MCRVMAGPMVTIAGLTGTFLGVALAIIRTRIDRRADIESAKKATSNNQSEPQKDNSTETKT